MSLADRISLTPSPAEVSRFNDWFDQKCAESGIERSLAADLKLCINEVLANLLSYGLKDRKKPWIMVRVELGPGRGAATIKDNGSYFDLRQWQTPKNRDLMTAEPGGFGIGLIKEYAADIRYSRICRVNRLRIVCEAPRNP